MKSQTMLYGTRVGAEDWQEDIITTDESLIPEAKEWARRNGFDRLRVATIDLTQPPDFAATLRV